MIQALFKCDNCGEEYTTDDITSESTEVSQLIPNDWSFNENGNLICCYCFDEEE
jgi:hypothetical protein